MSNPKENIANIERELKELKKKEEEFRKYAEYFNRQTREVDTSEERFLKSKGKEEYWRMRQSGYSLRVKEKEGQIALAKINEQRKEYRNKLISCYGAVEKHLAILKTGLEKRDFSSIRQTLNLLDPVYTRLESLEKGDSRLVTGYLPLSGIKIRLGRINEEMGLEVGINASYGGTSVGAQKRSNVAIWSGQLVSQIESLLRTLKERIRMVEHEI
jgi:hypothetical protein